MNFTEVLAFRSAMKCLDFQRPRLRLHRPVQRILPPWFPLQILLSHAVHEAGLLQGVNLLLLRRFGLWKVGPIFVCALVTFDRHISLRLFGPFLDNSRQKAPYILVLLKELILMSISEAICNLEVDFAQVDSLFIWHGIHYPIPGAFAYFHQFEYCEPKNEHTG